MEKSDNCIFCENPVIIHNPTYADKFKKKGSSSPTISTVDGDLKVGSQTNSKKYFECTECQVDYIPAKVDLELLLTNLDVKANVGIRLDYFYPKVTLQELILNHRTGIAKKPEHVSSWVSQDLVKRQLLMGFNINNVKTIGTFIRKKKMKGHYTMTMLERI